MMDQNETNTVLITGASSGIGLELAKIFAQNGHDLVLIARSKGKLEGLARQLRKHQQIKADVIAKDLARPESPDEIFNEIRNSGKTINILVNNAGFGTMTLFAEADIENTLQMIQLNITSLTHLTRLFLPSMIEHKYGRILNVASTAAFQPGPLMAVYYASKAYVLSFSEALSQELSGTGVTVTTLCPGPTRTGFQERAGIERTYLAKSIVMKGSKAVAKAGYEALMANKRVAVPGLLNKIGIVATKYLPHSITMKIIARLKNEK